MTAVRTISHGAVAWVGDVGTLTDEQLDERTHSLEAWIAADVAYGRPHGYDVIDKLRAAYDARSIRAGLTPRFVAASLTTEDGKQ